MEAKEIDLSGLDIDGYEETIFEGEFADILAEKYKKDLVSSIKHILKEPMSFFMVNYDSKNENVTHIDVLVGFNDINVDIIFSFEQIIEQCFSGRNDHESKLIADYLRKLADKIENK